MNTFFLICLAGIIINSVGIAFNIYILNIIGWIVTTIGIYKLNISALALKKSRLHATLAIPFSIIAYALTFINMPDGYKNVMSVALGINIFFYIYFTYYFTESLIQCAKSLNELASTRTFRSTWTLCGLITFIYFIAYYSLVPGIVTIVKIIFMISMLYYCSTINASSKILFKEKQ